MRVEVDVLGSPSLMVSVDVKQHLKTKKEKQKQKNKKHPPSVVLNVDFCAHYGDYVAYNSCFWGPCDCFPQPLKHNDVEYTSYFALACFPPPEYVCYCSGGGGSFFLGGGGGCLKRF